MIERSGMDKRAGACCVGLPPELEHLGFEVTLETGWVRVSVSVSFRVDIKVKGWGQG